MTVEERIRGRKIGVIGMARSGMAAALLAKEMGGIAFVSDAGPAGKLIEATSQLDRSAIPYETGGHSDRLLECDYVIISPGIPLSAAIARRVREKGIPLFSEIEFASWVCRGKILAVTGSNGKTTTTTLVGEICKAAGIETYVCGNIGLSFAEVATRVPSDGVAVVEVSSFQLETIADFRPHVAAILNITPDHLDRHGSMEVYKGLKYRVTENQTAQDFFVTNADDDISAHDTIDTNATRVRFTVTNSADADVFVRDNTLWLRDGNGESEVIAASEIYIPGPHNLQNAAAAVAMTSRIGVSPSVMAEVLRTFPGVEHRLERAGTVAGVNFINDSKATNVDSVVWALRSVDTPLYLIMGGREKGAPYTPIANEGRGKIRGIVAIGEAKENIFAQLGREYAVQFAGSLEEAVRKCFELAIPGETVLLSPACASFDMFDNFEQRGRVFKAAVASLKNGKKDHNTINS